MKIMITFLSAIVIFLGIIPFFSTFFIPNKGVGYSVVLIIVGLVILIAAIANSFLVGLEKAFLSLEGILVALVGFKALFPSLMVFLPATGLILPTIIIVIGAAFFIYGVIGMG